MYLYVLAAVTQLFFTSVHNEAMERYYLSIKMKYCVFIIFLQTLTVFQVIICFQMLI